MNTFHLRVYVGPTLVNGMACMFRAAGIPVMVEGTQHIHCAVDADDSWGAATHEFMRRLHVKFGHTFCLVFNDVSVIRKMAHATEASFSHDGSANALPSL